MAYLDFIRLSWPFRRAIQDPTLPPQLDDLSDVARGIKPAHFPIKEVRKP